MFKFIKKIIYDLEQKKINEKFLTDGLTAELLDKQVSLNMKRHKNDIQDSSEVLYSNELGQDFVQ